MSKLRSGFSGMYRKKRHWKCKHINTAVKVSDRQERIPGWDQARLATSTGLFIGAGGANGEVCEGVIQKGIGKAHIVDHDLVSPSNLNRQKFLDRDIYKNKAIRLCKNLSARGFLGTRLIAHPCSSEEIDIARLNPDFVVCSIDNQYPEERLSICRTCHSLRIACIFFAVSLDADYGYIFVQEPDSACWACVQKPEYKNRDAESQERCPGVPACGDILKTLGGVALYAIDTLLMDRKRDWNYRVISLSRSDFGSSKLVPPRQGCPVCGS